MDPRQMGWATVIGAAFLGAAVAAVWSFAPAANSGFRDAAAALGLVSATALGIERVIEAGWMIVGGLGKAGHWFGRGAAAKQASEMLDGLNESLQPFFERVEQRLTALKQDGQKAYSDRVDEALTDLKARREQLAVGLTELDGMTNSDEKAAAMVATAQEALQHVAITQARFADDIRVAAAAAERSVVAITDLVKTFRDNPAKRLISIYVSMILGLAVSAIAGADLFSAALAQPDASVGGTRVGVILSGLLIGLGAAPTHEVIKILQSVRDGRRGQPTGTPLIATEGLLSLATAQDRVAEKVV